MGEKSSKTTTGTFGKWTISATVRPAGKKPKSDLVTIMAKIPAKAGKAAPSARASTLTASKGALPTPATSYRLASPTVLGIPCPPGLGKRSRDASPEAVAGPGIGKGLFRCRINQQLGVKSLWDTVEPEVAYGLTRPLIHDHDAARLTMLRSDELEREACADSGRTVQIVSKLRHQSDQAEQKVRHLEHELKERDSNIRTFEEKVALVEVRDATTSA